MAGRSQDATAHDLYDFTVKSRPKASTLIVNSPDGDSMPDHVLEHDKLYWQPAPAS